MTAPVGKDRFDWAEEWRRVQALRKPADSRAYWNDRARSFKKQAGTSGYAERFLELCAFQPGETVLDMGCGSGVLAIPLAEAGHRVVAADFSTNMLVCLEEGAREKGVWDRIEAVEASWDDDWDDAGIPVCDVAIASRSLSTMDLEACLLKFEARARRRCCVTLATADSPRFDPVLYRTLGRSLDVGGEYIYAMNILWQMGRRPELNYILSAKRDMYASLEEARERVRLALGELTPAEESALELFCEEHLETYTDEDGNVFWGRDYPVHADWAFISWTPEGAPAR